MREKTITKSYEAVELGIKEFAWEAHVADVIIHRCGDILFMTICSKIFFYENSEVVELLDIPAIYFTREAKMEGGKLYRFLEYDVYTGEVSLTNGFAENLMDQGTKDYIPIIRLRKDLEQRVLQAIETKIKEVKDADSIV